MSRLPFEAFLALRYLRPRRTFVSVITVISIIGVMLGVAVMLIVISVMSGFDQEWRKGIFDFNSHLKVYGVDSRNIADYEKFQPTLASVPGVIGASPFIKCQVMIETESDTNNIQIAAPILLGVDEETVGKVSILPASIKEGHFDLSSDGMIVGRDFAEQYGLRVGDRIAVYSASSIKEEMANRNRTDGGTKQRVADEFVVRGIFDVGFGDYNASVVVVSLNRAQELNSLSENTTQGFQVKLTDPFRADEIGAAIRAKFKDEVETRTWREDNKHIFDSLAMEKNTMFFILFFIVIVAAFGIVNCQITFVVQKTREIGILKAIGADSKQVLLLFLSQSVIVGVLGVGCGLALGLLTIHYRNDFLHFLRHVTHQEIMPSSIYQLYELPASLETGDVVMICATAFLACVLAGLFPAWKASRLQPVEALRHE